MTYRPHMLPKVRSSLIMASAAGSPCTLRIATFVPGLMCADRSTTVGAHLPIGGKGTSTKGTDMAVAFACGVCHRLLDEPSPMERKYLDSYGGAVLDRMLRGLVETHALLIDQGIIVIPDAEFLFP